MAALTARSERRIVWRRLRTPAQAAWGVFLALSAWSGESEAASRVEGGTCIEVIAHRGASGYLSEHTLPAYALGYGQGAHWIEPDLVLTADGVPIALHDVTLDRTTNVAETFAGRAREDGLHYAQDFTYAEISRLRVVEARPGRYPYAMFRVPTLADVLELVQGLNRTTGRRVGIYPELKSPAAQPALAAKTLHVLEGANLPIFLQSFDAEALAALDTDLPRIQLLGELERIADSTLDAMAEYAVGIGAFKGLLFHDPSLVARAHAKGLAVHAYTLRADHVDSAFDSLAGEVAALAALGVDALFTDHPDQVISALGNTACPSAPP